MATTKRVFISDVHLGKGGNTDWYKKDIHDSRLLNFLDYVCANADKIKDLVLVGDIFDTWVWNMVDDPPKVEDILEHNNNIVEKLKDAVGELQNVFYLNGNHDMHVTEEDLSSIKKNGKKIQCIKEYRSGGLFAVHGHNHAMFNAIDQLNDPGRGLPLGYFISRMLAGDDSYTSPGAILQYVDDLLEAAITTQTISESVIEAMMEHTKKHPQEQFKMPEGRQPVSIEHVKRQYAGLYEKWVEKFGYRYALKAISGEMGSLGWFADRICKKRDFKVVVMGHTHDSEFDKDTPIFGKERIYINSGYWCGDTSHFVLADKLNGSFEVSLVRVNDDNTFEPVRTESV